MESTGKIGISSDQKSDRMDGRIAVAPWMDWTDRHCRYFLRGFSPDVLLYSEMITAAAIVRGDRARLLAFDPEEHPVALQLGGGEPRELAAAARAGEQAGYDEINLNCGCPSERVASGAFGACLMHEPARVAECVAAMRAAVRAPVTVKMRIGVADESAGGRGLPRALRARGVAPGAAPGGGRRAHARGAQRAQGALRRAPARRGRTARGDPPPHARPVQR